MLPPQLPGLDVTKVSWHGRTFNIAIGPKFTKVTLTSGHALPLKVGDRPIQTAYSHQTLSFPTRRPDLSATNDVARCRKVTATSANESFPADAAVDGSPATSRQPTAPGASLTVDLGKAQAIDRIEVDSATGMTTPYSIEVSSDGTTWQQVGTISAGSSPWSDLVFSTVDARWVRYSAGAGVTPDVSSLEVIPAPAP